MGLLGHRFHSEEPRHTPRGDLLEDYRALAKLLDKLFTRIEAEIRPGVKTSLFDSIAEKFIKDTGVQSSFKSYRGFPAHVTTSVNQEVLNTPPSSRELVDGDLFKIQAGIKDGVGHSYQAWTYFVGQPGPEDEPFVAAGNEALERALRQVKARGQVTEISRAIQGTLEGAGYSANRQYVGHGMGRNQHELPQVPCWVMDPPDLMEYALPPGQLLSIQVIAHAGSHECRTMRDRWSVETKDHSRALTLSQIVAAGETGPEIITPPRSSQPGA